MDWQKATYLALDLFSLAGPLAYGFTRHSGFNRRWRQFLPGLLFTALLFILWDAAFTRAGIWGFNPRYYGGWKWGVLPLEEILFFICIPFACLFIYDAVGRLPDFLSEKKARLTCAAGCVITFAVAAFSWPKAYTLSAFGLASLCLLALSLGALKPKTGKWVIAYGFHLIPFFLVNGVLTSLPVVLYNPEHHLGFRLGTIPLEDAFYSLSLLSLNVFLFERGKKRHPLPE